MATARRTSAIRLRPGGMGESLESKSACRSAGCRETGDHGRGLGGRRNGEGDCANNSCAVMVIDWGCDTCEGLGSSRNNAAASGCSKKGVSSLVWLLEPLAVRGGV